MGPADQEPLARYGMGVRLRAEERCEGVECLLTGLPNCVRYGPA